MLKENEFFIDGHKNLRIGMTFQVMTWNNSFVEDVLVDCSEDIESVMKLYFNKEWKKLFHDWNGGNTSGWFKKITDVSFDSMYITAKEEGKGNTYTVIGNSPIVAVTVDLGSMGDKNAAKINEIRSIINK